jgi:3-isopropylmalate/(R)-2-methylmalate dehydratase large subunit
MSGPKTLFEKVWEPHAILEREDGTTLLWIDRHFVHEGSFHGFGMLDHAGRALARPDLTFAVADHYVPSHARNLPIRDPEVAGMVQTLRGNAARHGLDLLDLDDARQGIVHVVGPEQGLTLPGGLWFAAIRIPPRMARLVPWRSGSAPRRSAMCWRHRPYGKSGRRRC